MKLCRHCNERPGTVTDCVKRYKDKVYEYYSCTDCGTERSRKYRQTDSGKAAFSRAAAKYIKENPDKYRAWMKAQSVKSEPCEVCGDTNTHRHHPDYSKPLQVEFLCPLHHKRKHMLQLS